MYAILWLLFAQFTAVDATAQTADTSLADDEHREEPKQNDTTTLLHALFGKAVLKGVSDTFLFRPSTRGNYLIIMPMLLVAVSNIKRRHSIILNSAWVVFILLICVPPILQNPILLLAPPIVMKLDYSTYKILRKPIIWIS
ncbi:MULTISPECIES: hypothetical protein [Hydrotalea]|uniref:hypothetical protein n=1 Tax=Hydrotalea TaxID=1004300 RepID=UPI00102851CB|nr:MULTISPECIES: hypothetical protein [Hydrotalea]RWZ87397.1 MAG: hypothetical protein EO766_11105 [Hydrotalea sp. AMD]